MTSFQPMTVTFDDGTQVIVTPKARDLAGAEAAGCDFTNGSNPIQAMYAVAWATLNRMARNGEVDPALLPESLAALLDGADVEAVEDPEDDPEGKG